MLKLPAQIALMAIPLGCCFAFSQTSPEPKNDTPSAAAVTSVTAQPEPEPKPCAEPARTYDLDEYTGPFSKRLASPQEKQGVTSLRQPDGSKVRPCPLNAGDKFHLFLEKSVKPTSFVHAGREAGWSHLQNDDPTFGQGAEGYGKRYGAALADSTSYRFFGSFLYPSIFRQDPRYYRLGYGGASQRLGHALSRVFVAHSDSGNPMPNYSEWFGTISYQALGNLYHPGNSRGFGPVARRTGMGIGTDMGWDVFREFWPDILRKFHLPFKKRDYTQNQPDSGNPKPSASDSKKPAPASSSSAAVSQ